MKDKRFVKRHKAYYAWEVEKEEQDLNELSRNGLQLIYGGCFHSKFRRDNGVVYRYRIDYRTRIPDRMDYRAAFAEQGWEYVNSTFNGWHYFRKPYDPTLPEAEYEIYTDRQSVAEMQNRWVRLNAIMGLLCLALGIFNVWLGIGFSSAMNIAVGSFDILIAIVILPGIRVAKKKRNGEKEPWYLPAKYFHPLIFTFLLVMVGALVVNAMGEHRTNFSEVIYEESEAFDFSGEENLTALGGTFTVTKTGWYDVSFAMDSGEVGVRFILTDEAGETVGDISATGLCNCSDTFRLQKGETYTVGYEFDGEAGDHSRVILLTSVWY